MTRRRIFAAWTLAVSAFALFLIACGANGGATSTGAPREVATRPPATLAVALAQSTLVLQPSATAEATPAPPSPGVTGTPEPTSTVGSTLVASPVASSAPPTPRPTLGAPPTVEPTASSTPAPATTSLTVTLTDLNTFSPATATVAVNGIVTFSWQGGQFHDLTIPGFPADPQGLKKTGIYQVTFSAPGRFAYFCPVHTSSGMRGLIIVQ